MSPVGAYAYLLWLAGWILGRRLPMLRATKPIAITAVVAFMVYSVGGLRR